MIQLWDTYAGHAIHVRHDTIRRVDDKPTHHGAKALIVTDDGEETYVQETPEWILAKIAEAEK